MVDARKILTLSCGTFSCTLEGCGDPCSALTAIAEYFGELAAEDRRFCAEARTHDAEMLHRIARHEIQRRLEAKIGASGAVMRLEGDFGSAPQPAVSECRDATGAEPAGPADAAPATEAVAIRRTRRARVIKVRRSEAAADAQPAPQAARAPAADPVLDAIAAALGETGLSAEDEAELLAELAAVEREATGARSPAAPAPAAGRQPAIEDAAVPGETDPPQGEPPAPGRGPTDEAAVSRLIETANSRLEGSETRRRLSAIAHLKAAVAATVAERALRRQASDAALAQEGEEAINRYREDPKDSVPGRRRPPG
ncbi:MAG: hypothetical protein H5U17_05200 [Defluviimonas sp.]|nr:hypothetical protein [Defluviimonas sp.]